MLLVLTQSKSFDPLGKTEARPFEVAEEETSKKIQGT